MKDGECSKRYPKAFKSTTAIGNNETYPEYQRPDNGRTVTK